MTLVLSPGQNRCLVFAILCASFTLNAIFYMNFLTNQNQVYNQTAETFLYTSRSREATRGKLRNVFGTQNVKYDYINPSSANENLQSDFQKGKKLDEMILKNRFWNRNGIPEQEANNHLNPENALHDLHISDGISRKLRSEIHYDSDTTVEDVKPEQIKNTFNYNYVINRPEICKSSNVTLLVIVCTGLNRFEERQAIRETWGSYREVNTSVKVIFLIGVGAGKKLQKKIERESVSYEDIVQVNFTDSYRNLSIKSVVALKWMLTFCKQAKYLFKSDDDIFLNVPNLMKTISTFTQKEFIMGHRINNAKPLQNKKSKWYTPRDQFPEDHYPHYVSGTGYMLTNKAVYTIYNTSLHTRMFWLEDIYITGICARKAEVKRIHHPGFTFELRRPDGCAFQRAITGHRVKVPEMYKIFAQLRNPDPKCNVKKFLLRP